MVYEQIAANRRASLLVCLIFAAVVILLGWLLGELWGVPWIGLAIALGISLGSVYTAYYSSDEIVLRMSGARPLLKAEHPHLFNSVEGLAIAAGIPAPRCYVIGDSAPNAFATGRDPAHGVVCVTTGLLDKMDRLQLEGVVAHEMSHIKNLDTRLQVLVAVLVGTTVLLSDWILRSMFYGRRGRRERVRGGQGMAILLLVGLVLALLAPLIAQLLRLAISRRREYLADASAALLTRYPEGLAGALEKLAADTEPLEAANRATAHLYIVNPLKGESRWQSLFDTHPPIADRVRRLRSM
jgi:heat shock protein HtpX